MKKLIWWIWRKLMPILDRTHFEIEEKVPHIIDPGDWRVATTLALLPVAADGTSLGRAYPAGGDTYILLGSITNNTSATETGRAEFSLPIEYVPDSTITFRLHARVDVARTVAATVDVSAYRCDFEGGVIGGDLCETVAQSINVTDWADYDFTLQGNGLTAGCLLDLLITVAADDTGGSVDGIAEVGATKMLLDVRG